MLYTIYMYIVSGGGCTRIKKRIMKRNIYVTYSNWLCKHSMGGRQNFERLNVERPIFRNFKIASIERKMSCDIVVSKFFFSKILEHPKYLIIFRVVKY